MISILRPLTPPWALMSSAAMTAALVSEAPATEDSSPITPILIGSVDCAEAGRAESPSVSPAHPKSHNRARPVKVFMVVLPVSGRCKSGAILVGQKKAVAIAVRNVSGRRRWSKLAEWLSADVSKRYVRALCGAARGRLAAVVL